MNADVLFMLKFIFTLALTAVVILALLLYFVVQMYLHYRPKTLKSTFGALPIFGDKVERVCEPLKSPSQAILIGLEKRISLLERYSENATVMLRLENMEQEIEHFNRRLEYINKVNAGLGKELESLKAANGTDGTYETNGTDAAPRPAGSGL